MHRRRSPTASRRRALAGLLGAFVAAVAGARLAEAATAPSATAAAAGDPFKVTSSASAQLAGPLLGALLVTSDAAIARRFFVDAMQMRLASERKPEGAELDAKRRLWGLGRTASWSELLFDRPAIRDAIRVRVLVLEGGRPVRPGMQARLQGGLSLGFPVADMPAREQRLSSLGFSSTAGITRMQMPRGNGATYEVQEIHFRGPEELYALGVWRPSDMTPVGPIEARSGIGGPAYSGLVVVNADAEIAFFREVLGWELRRDIALTSAGTRGGLGLPDGTRYRFVQLFAPGAITGYLVLLDMQDRSMPNPVVPRPPNRGLVGWRFETRRFDEILRRATANGRTTIYGGPLALAEGAGAAQRAMTLLSPGGSLLEIVEVGARSAP